MSGSGLLVQQAPLFDGFGFDPFSLLQNGLATSRPDIGRREIAEALMIVRDQDRWMTFYRPEG